MIFSLINIYNNVNNFHVKKIVAIVIVMLAVASNVRTPKFSLANFFDGRVTYYNQYEDCSKKNLGFCYVSKVKPNGVIGESVELDNVELNSIISTLNADIIKTEMVEDEVIVYAYSNKIPTSVELFNKRVNLQIAYTETKCVVGWPLILGDF